MADWIEWKGGECPVDPHTRVMVKCAGFGDETDTADAGVYSLGDGDDWWRHNEKPTDIIAYRIVERLSS